MQEAKLDGGVLLEARYDHNASPNETLPKIMISDSQHHLSLRLDQVVSKLHARLVTDHRRHLAIRGLCDYLATLVPDAGAASTDLRTNQVYLQANTVEEHNKFHQAYLEAIDRQNDGCSVYFMDHQLSLPAFLHLSDYVMTGVALRTNGGVYNDPRLPVIKNLARLSTATETSSHVAQ